MKIEKFFTKSGWVYLHGLSGITFSTLETQGCSVNLQASYVMILQDFRGW
ncbi:MAG: hypothetical protein R3B93_24370 [Bacteroidia bacterium]